MNKFELRRVATGHYAIRRNMWRMCYVKKMYGGEGSKDYWLIGEYGQMGVKVGLTVDMMEIRFPSTKAAFAFVKLVVA
jgi:hypothetical protein